MTNSDPRFSADSASVAEKLLGTAAMGLMFGLCFWMNWVGGIVFAALIPSIWWPEGDER